MQLSKPQRDVLRMKFGGMCAYCGSELPEKGWHADHVEPVLREWWKKHRTFRWEIAETGHPVKIENPAGGEMSDKRKDQAAGGERER